MTTVTPDAASSAGFVRSIVLIDPHHNAHTEGAAASLTVVVGVGLDDSLALPGVAVVGAELSPEYALLARLRVAAEHVEIADGQVTVCGRPVLLPVLLEDVPVAFTDEQGRWLTGGWRPGKRGIDGAHKPDGAHTCEVLMFVQSILVRSPRAEEIERCNLDWTACQAWASPRH